MPVRLTPTQRSDLEKVCGIGAAKLNRVIDAVDVGAPTIKRSKLREAIAAAIGGDQDVAAATTRVLIGLATAVRKAAVPIPDLLDGVRQTVADTWNKEQLQAWHECSPIVERLLSHKSVMLTAKALDLSYDFETIFNSARILTDFRPVYDEEKEGIVGGIITQTLRIDYSSDKTDGSLALALDNRDIEQLKTACEEALLKGVRARELSEEKLQVDIIIPGEGPQ